MNATTLRGALAEAKRLIRDLKAWTDARSAPFSEGCILPAALALVQAKGGFLAAEIDVPLARLRQYVDVDCAVLSKPERRRLRRFFSSRGVYELRLLGWQGLLFWPPTAWRANERSLSDQAKAMRIIRYKQDQGVGL